MKFISWNVNGLRACVQKGFIDYFKEADADFSVCKRQNCRRDRLILRRKAITVTGITQ